MVTTLAHSQHGRQYLAQQGIMDKLSNMIRGADSDPFSSLYLPGESLDKTAREPIQSDYSQFSVSLLCFGLFEFLNELLIQI